MIKQLTRSGNSLALVLDKPLLELIHIDPQSPVVELTAEKDGIVIRAAGPERVAELRDRKHRIRESLERVNKRHEATLRRLAK